jgi:hypothetical protein
MHTETKLNMPKLVGVWYWRKLATIRAQLQRQPIAHVT